MNIGYFNSFFHWFMKPINQFMFISLTVVLLSIFLYYPLTKFVAFDPQPAIHPIVPQLQAEGVEAAVPVQVGMFIVNFPVFELNKNEFTADLTLWFEFDPSLLPLEVIDKFSFNRGTIVKKAEPDMKLLGNKLFVHYGIRLTFTSQLNHVLFPLSDHFLYITLKNEYVSPQEVIFLSQRTSFLIASDAHTADWSIVDRRTQTGYFESELDPADPRKSIRYPGVVFTLDLSKTGIREIFIIMLPMVILLFIALFSFSLDPQPLARSILALSVGTLTGLIGYRFVIEKIIPQVGYFTLTDHLFNLFLTVIFITFIINLYAVNQGSNTSKVLMVKSIAFIAIQALLFFSFYFLTRTS